MNPALHTASDVMHLLETKEIAYYGLRDAYRAFRPTWERTDPVAERLFAHDFATRWAIFEAVSKIAHEEVAEARQVAIRLSLYPSETVWLALSCMDAQLPGTVSPGDFIDLSARLAVAAKAANFPMNIPANVLIGIPNVPPDFGAYLADAAFGFDRDTDVDQSTPAPSGSGTRDTVRPGEGAPEASREASTGAASSTASDDREELFTSIVTQSLDILTMLPRLSPKEKLGLGFIVATFISLTGMLEALRTARRAAKAA